MYRTVFWTLWEREREGVGRSLEEGMITHSCLENPMDREAWWATVHGVAEFDRTE